MSETRSDDKLLSRTATLSSIAGIGALLVPLSIFLVFFSLVFPALIGAHLEPSPPLDPTTVYPYQIVTQIAIFAGATVVAVFSYYNYRLGISCSVPTLKKAGKAGVMVSIPAFILASFEFGLLTSVFHGSSLLYSPVYLALFVLPVLVTIFVGLEFYVTMYRGFGGMREKTAVKDFDTAGLWWLLGLFVPLTIGVAMIVYSSALRKVTKEKQRIIAQPRMSFQLESQANCCSRCGAELEPGARFCSVCGSPIRHEE